MAGIRYEQLDKIDIESYLSTHEDRVSLRGVTRQTIIDRIKLLTDEEKATLDLVPATQSKLGLMSPVDKTKVDNLETTLQAERNVTNQSISTLNTNLTESINQNVTALQNSINLEKDGRVNDVSTLTQALEAEVTHRTNADIDLNNNIVVNFNDLNSRKAEKNGSTTEDFSVKDLTVTGNMLVQGDTFIVDTEHVEVQDNLILVNKGEVGEGVTAGMAGLKVDRGSLEPYLIIFSETEDMFMVGVEGDLEVIASQPYVNQVVNVERTERTSAVTSLQNDLQSSIASEESARLLADETMNTNLTSLINTEKQQRIDAIDALENVVNTKVHIYTDVVEVDILADGQTDLGIPSDKVVKVLGVSVDGVTHYGYHALNVTTKVVTWTGPFQLLDRHKVFILFNRTL